MSPARSPGAADSPHAMVLNEATPSASPSDAAPARYAVYFAPPADSLLWQCASAWLGRDAKTGASVPRRLPDACDAATAEALTAVPGRYGFHATLKAPFELRAGLEPDALREAVAELAGRIAPFEAPPLVVGELSRFLCLRLAEPCAPMQALAAAAVTELDWLRAPPTAADLARRQSAGLDARRAALLALWGYPHVLECFRFHMTLTAAVESEALRARLATGLQALFAPALDRPLPVREVCLFHQPQRSAPFTILRRFALSGR